MVTGHFQINVTPEDADLVYVSERGPPNPAKAARLDGRVYETAAQVVWFIGVDSKGVAKMGEVCEWRAPIRVKLDVKRVTGGYRALLMAIPRAAVLRATFDGSDPRGGPEVPHGEMDAPADAQLLRAVAEVQGSLVKRRPRPSRARLAGTVTAGPSRS